MTSREKKALVLRQVVKPELKQAGYKSAGTVFHRIEEDCCLAIHVQSSNFNSDVTGYAFWFNIAAFPPDLPPDHIRSGGCKDLIREAALLPDCGKLHPYRDSRGYCIDGYRNYQPLDMDVEDIQERIRDDLRHHILPQLAGIKTLSDWKGMIAEWKQRYNTKRVLLLRYFDLAQESSESLNNIPHLRDVLREFGLTAEEIEENRELYQQVRAFSTWPDQDKWGFIRSTLLQLV